MIRFLLTKNDSKTIVTIAGKLEDESLAGLEALCADARGAVLFDLFDLSELRAADEASIRWLRERLEKGARVTGASPYIKLLIQRQLQRSNPATARTNKQTK